MKPFILLLKIQLLGLFGINKTLHADPAKAKRTLALAALVVAAVVLFASAYSAGVAQGLVQIGLAEAVPLVAVLVGAIAGAVAAFLKTNGVLFGFKDYDLVMSLPVPTSSVVLSRIASLYAMSLLFGVLVMVPAFAVYASAAGVSAVGVACMALSIVLAPLLPLAAAVVLAVLIAAVSSRFKHANVAVIVLTLAATLAAVFGSFALSGQSDDLVECARRPADGAARGHLPAGRMGDCRHRAGRPRAVRRLRCGQHRGCGGSVCAGRAPIRAGELAAHVVQAARDVLVRRR